MAVAKRATVEVTMCARGAKLLKWRDTMCTRRVLVAVLLTFGLVLAVAPAARAQIVIAEDLLIFLDAQNLDVGEIDEWANIDGSLGGVFAANGTPEVTVVDDGTISATAVTLDGASWFHGMESPEGITGGGTRSVEYWAFNPDVAGEETVFAWGATAAAMGGPTRHTTTGAAGPGAR